MIKEYKERINQTKSNPDEQFQRDKLIFMRPLRPGQGYCLQDLRDHAHPIDRRSSMLSDR